LPIESKATPTADDKRALVAGPPFAVAEGRGPSTRNGRNRVRLRLAQGGREKAAITTSPAITACDRKTMGIEKSFTENANSNPSHPLRVTVLAKQAA
jgi:hypothetical protein